MLRNLNFWDEYKDYFLLSQANKTLKWSGPDNEETYKKVIQSKVKTYSFEAFSYTRNSLGFRSMEFDNSDPVKILYGGCSITEGVGLPIDHTWQAFLNERISHEIEKPVKMYNIGIGGLSIDAICRYAYITVKNKTFLPDVVILLLPSPARNELVKLDRFSVASMYNFIPNFVAYDDPEIKRIHSNTIKTMSMRQRVHDAFQNLLMLQGILDLHNIPLFVSTWDRSNFVVGPAGAQTNLGECLKTYAPKSLRSCFIDATMIFDRDSHTPNFELKFPFGIGRDGMHPGPNSHWNFAKDAFAILKEKEQFSNLLNKWKNHA